MKILISLFLAFFLLGSCKEIPFFPNYPTSSVSYRDHKVLYVPYNEDVKLMIDAQNLDLFSVTADSFAIIHVSPSQYQLLIESFPNLDIVVLEENLQKMIDLEALAISHSGDDWFASYHPYEDIVEWYKKLAVEFSHLMKIESAGKTHEGRDIFALRITSPKGGANKKQIYFQGQIHAREWISGATVGYIVHNFLTKYGTDQTISDILDTMELLVIPCLNADGYAYSWKSDRLWRKNRRDNGKGYQFGVDLNRNFNSNWGEGGSSRSPSSETYMGPYVASEPETQTVTKFFLSNTNIVGAIDFHSFSQLILRPFGSKFRVARHEDQLRALGDKMGEIIKSVHGLTYTSMRCVDLYPATGGASDWFYDDEVFNKFGHRAYGYTIELRPTGRLAQGFLLHPKFIIPTGEEILPAFIKFAQTSRDSPLL